MSVINAFWMWTGLAAAGVAVPIVIHLLYRKHRRQTDWAAMELLRRALVVRSGQVRFEDYLILFLRCLALLLIALAMLRPFLKKSDLAGKQRIAMVIAIDASFSMNHGANESRFSQAVDKARKVLETANAGDPVTIVLMSSHPRILERQKGFEEGEFREVLDSLKLASPYTLNLESNLEQIEELVGEFKAGTRECYLITDCQQTDWNDASPEALAAFQRISEEANLFVVPVHAGGVDNVSLTKLTYESGALQKSGRARFTAMVRNEGTDDLTNGGTVTFSVGGKPVDQTSFGKIAPGQSTPVSFHARLDDIGDIPLKAELQTDSLKDDNVRHAIVSVRESINVLCVDDLSSEERNTSRTGTYYAAKVFRNRDAEVQLSLTQFRTSELRNYKESLDFFDVIILANVADPPVPRLTEFVEQGGNLMLFLGDQIDAKFYNEQFGIGSGSLLPAAIDALLPSDNEAGWPLAPVTSKHSLADAPRQIPDVLDNARFLKVMQVKPTAESHTVLTLGNQKSSPLLLTREFGSGTVLMFTTSADRQWNNLPIHPLYPILLRHAVTTLTSHPHARRTIVGGAMELPIEGRQVGDRVEVRDPKQISSELKISLVGQNPVCVIDTKDVGIYTISGKEGGEQSEGTADMAIAANFDPTESNVQVIDSALLSSQLAPIGVKVFSSTGALTGAILSSREGRDLTNIFWLAGLFVLILQGLLAKYFTDRMGEPETDVAASLQMSQVSAARRT